MAVFDWQLYMQFAETISAAIKSETGYRNAVSRSYYAAYWRARRLLESRSARIPRMSSHEFVYKSYMGVLNSDAESLGELLKTLRDGRSWADYDDIPEVTKNHAETAVQDAKDVISALNALSNTEIAKAVQVANTIYADFQPRR